MSGSDRGTILVIGGTGTTGRRVVDRLQARGGHAVRVGSRAGSPAFHWEDRATWAPVLAGTDAVYIAYHPDLAVPGAADTVGAFARLAVRHGVRRIVLLSGRGEDEAQRAEVAVQDAGAEWTVVRCAWFNQDFSETFLREAVIAGDMALPVDGVAEPFVDVDDIADVAVAALTEDGHAGHVYELTGPRLLRFDEVADEIARASGRPVRFTPVPADAFAGEMSAAGVPHDEVELMMYLFREVLDGRNEHLADGVRRALGREPTDFADFARRAAAAGAWHR